MNDLLHRHGNQFGDTGIQFDIDIDNPSLAVVDEGNGATVIADIPLVQIGHKTTGNISPSTSLSGLAPIVATTTAGSHLTILATYDTSITSLNNNGNANDQATYNGYMSAIASAIAYYSNLIVNPMTITIAFGYGEAGGNPIAGGGGSGQSSFSVIPVSYSTLYNAVKTNFTSGTAVQQVALATLPNTDPTGGGQFTVSTAQALALGIPTGGVTAGGSVGIGVGTYNWTQTGFTGSQNDAISIIDHEISEVLGRSDSGGKPSNGTPAYSLLDLFRYTVAGGADGAAPGTAVAARDQPFVAGYNANAFSYFSYNGQTVTLEYDTPADVALGNDIADWGPNVANDSFGFGTTGAAQPVSATDLQELQSIGYATAGSLNITIAAGGTVTVPGTLSATQTVTFSPGAPGTLILSSPAAAIATPIAGFAAGDTIDFAGVTYKSSYRANWSVSATGGGLQVVDSAASNAVVETLTFASTLSGSAFTLGSDGGSGFNLSLIALPAVTPSPGQVVTSGVPGQPYAAYMQLNSKGVFTGTRYSYVAAGQAYGSYNYDFSPGGAFIGSAFYYTGITGKPYTGNTIAYDPAGNATRTLFTGITGSAYSSYEYDYVGGVFAGSKFTVTNPPIGASYASYELDYNASSALTAQKFFYTGITGQSYTSEEVDYTGASQLSRVLLNGFSTTPYASLELDYNAGAYTGFKVFYTGQSGLFTNIEQDVTAANAVTRVIYSGPTTTPYSSVEQSYSGGVLTGLAYNFTNVSGTSYYAYHVTQTAAGATTQEVFDLNTGGHAIYAFANLQFLQSQGSDTFVGQTFGNLTFALTPVYGAETFADFASHLSGATHDTIQFSVTEFANFNAMTAATTDTANGARILAPNGDTVTLAGVTKVQILANAGDFAFA